MGFLKKLFGGSDGTGDDAAAPPPTAAELDEAERAHELELARFEQDRTTELVRRQQQYSDKSWVPPAQGGTVRAGDDPDTDGPDGTADRD